MEQSQRDDSLAVRGARSVSSLPPPAYPRPLHAHVTFIPRLYTQVKKTRGCCSRVGLLHWILLLPRALDAFAYGSSLLHAGAPRSWRAGGKRPCAHTLPPAPSCGGQAFLSADSPVAGHRLQALGLRASAVVAHGLGVLWHVGPSGTRGHTCVP